MTAKSSANVVHLRLNGSGEVKGDLSQLAEDIAGFIRRNFDPGSDPGLCVAADLPPAVVEFGRRTKTALVTTDEARELADAHNLILQALGGDGTGIIGALAGVGLASTGDDGRFTSVGDVRDLRGVQPVEAILEAGVAGVQTLEGEPVTDGLVETGSKLRPALIGGKPVLLVEPADGVWRATHRD